MIHPSCRVAAARLGLLAVLSVLPVAPAAAQAVPGDSASVVAVLDQFHAALRSGDSAAALALLTPDAVIVESGGVETLAEYRSHHLPGDIRFARTTERRPGPVGVRISGSTAWAWGTAETSGTVRGEAFSSTGAELAVLTRVADGQWRISAIHWSSRRRNQP